MSERLLQRTWKAAGEVGEGRRAAPREVSGQQAHAILHHDMDVEEALATDVTTHARTHSRQHAHGSGHKRDV